MDSCGGVTDTGASQHGLSDPEKAGASDRMADEDRVKI